MDVLRAADEGDAHARADRRRLHRELGALLLQLGHRRVDAADLEPEMFEALERRLRRRPDLVRIDPGDEHGHAAEIEVDPLASVRLSRADDPGAEHPFIITGRLFRVRAAQVHVVVCEGGHRDLPD
jgi:hypothetical protein